MWDVGKGSADSMASEVGTAVTTAAPSIPQKEKNVPRSRVTSSRVTFRSAPISEMHIGVHLGTWIIEPSGLQIALGFLKSRNR